MSRLSSNTLRRTPWQNAVARGCAQIRVWVRPHAVAVLLLLFALAWIGMLHGTRLTVPKDNVEQWVWSAALQWGYHKHPPLPTWWLWLAHQVTGREALTAVVLGAACSLASVGLLYALLRKVWSPKLAWVCVLAALSITFYSGRLNYYNHNITLMLCVSLTVYSWWQILATGRTRWWILLGVAAGLGMLSKYQYLLTLAPGLVCLLWLQPWRSRRVLGQLALALAIAAVLFAPHALWLAQQTAGATPIDYALQTSKPQWWTGSLSASAHSGIWLLDLILNRCLPAVLVLVAAKALQNRLAAGSPAALRAPAVPHGPVPPRHAEAFLLLWGLLPVACMTLLGMVLSMDLQMHWGTAFALWLVPAGVILLRLHRARLTDAVALGALGVFLILQTFLLAETYSTSTAGCCPNPNRWRNFDTPQLARELDAAARESAGGRFNILVGPMGATGAIAMRLPEQPRVLIDGNARISPWIRPDELDQPGVIEILPPGPLAPDARRMSGGWSWRIYTPAQR